MVALIPNISLAKWARDGELELANDEIVWILWESAAAPTDEQFRDTDDVAALEAIGNEVTAGWYSRQVAVGTTVVEDDTANDIRIDCTTNPVWSPTTAVALGDIIAAYDNDNTGGTDANIRPIFHDDFVLTTATSGTLTYVIDGTAPGFMTASE